MAKRKEIEEAMEGLSFPQFKIRRLVVPIPPFDSRLTYLSTRVQPSTGPEPNLPHPLSETTHTMDEIVPPLSEMTCTVHETFSPPTSSTDDRAIVLYTPADTFLNLEPLPSNPSLSVRNPSLSVSPELLRNLKNQVLHQGSYQNLEYKSPAGNDCLAVVPWVPSVAAEMASYWSSSQQDQNPATIEELESEESTSMEVETEPVESHRLEDGGIEGFHHQWQLHCMAPGTQPNPTSHLMWSQ